MIDTTNTGYSYLSERVVEGGTLNEQGVLNVALQFFGLVRNISTDAQEKEVVLFNQTLPGAEVFCASLSDWSFLIDTVEYEESDIENNEPVLNSEYKETAGRVGGDTYTQNGNVYRNVYTPYKNFLYAYQVPSGFLKLKYINGDHKLGFARKGNLIYCNQKPVTIDYVSSNMKNLPDDFGYLVAYKCAMDMAQHLDPEGTALTRASAMFQQVLSILKPRDDQATRLQNPPQDYYVNMNTAYWNRGGHKK